jgi:GTP-binding protein
LFADELQEPLILAEIPGLIPGAHLGKGLGHRFLRHIKRTRLLVMVIDVSGVDPPRPLAPLQELDAEMTAFDPSLAARPRLVVLNKTDLLAADFPREAVLRAYEDAGLRTFIVSAKSGAGIPELRTALWEEAARLVGTSPEEDKIFLP